MYPSTDAVIPSLELQNQSFTIWNYRDIIYETTLVYYQPFINTPPSTLILSTLALVAVVCKIKSLHQVTYLSDDV